MCEFCVKHGEGKKWYLNVKNYSNDLLNDIKRRDFVINSAYWINSAYNKIKFVKFLPLSMPILGNIFRGIIKRSLLYEHWGQVIPIEDAEHIINFTNSITRIPCICRKVTKGNEVRTCFLLSLDPRKTGMADIVDQSFFGGPDVAKFEKVDKKWAIDFMKESEIKGRIHTVWTLKTPFIGAICNCDLSTGCIPMKMYSENAPITFRAEYVAELDENSCMGCRECLKICPFGAIEFDKKVKKIKIDPKKCYGCGICRIVCKKNALTLQNRHAVPEASHLW